MNSLFRKSRRCARSIKRCVRLIERCAFFFLPPALYHMLIHCLPRFFQREVQQQLVHAVRRRLSKPGANEKVASTTNPSQIAEKLNAAYWLPERQKSEAKRKADCYREFLAAGFDRIHTNREIARLERMQGNDLIAAVYALRAIRLAGKDAHGEMTWVKPVLLQHGYIHEAATVDSMYGEYADREERCRRLLNEAFDRCRVAPEPCDFAAFDDRRGNLQPRVSVIVSLYNAASKIPVFSEALRQQTLLRTQQLELIFVDSASPADEHRAVRESLKEAEVPYLFVRTAERETIQTAWNRGIALARAPYLAFLGVDETVLPTAYEELADELDRHADIDWVMADSLVMEVDPQGNPFRDVMVYDRNGYTQDLVYLETCYLSWVGGLYRKSIHERFGYYDGSYGAAGDTEFKGRILPHIKTLHFPKVLGVFLNYPEERTTASPKAELEDYRAWYLHRSEGGVRYAFDRRDASELEAMLPQALNYRKSYSGRMSSDAEYAVAVARVLRERLPNSRMLALAEGAERLLEAYRAIDEVDGVGDRAVDSAWSAIRDAVVAVQNEHRATPYLPAADYELLRDNRYEQHTHPW